MPDYNPNSIWGSKEKKYVYTPPGDPTSYTQIPGKTIVEPPSGGNPGGAPKGAPAGGPHSSSSFFRKNGLIFFAIGIFILIGFAAIVYYLLLPAPAPNVAIAFTDPGAIVIGEPFPVVISVTNESKSVLQNAELNIALPSGISFASGTSATQSVGTLSSETINPPNVLWLVATGDAGTAQTLSATLTYGTPSTASTIFKTTAATSLSIGTQSALSISYSAPSSIFSGQNFNLVVNYQNNTTGTLQGVQLKMQYPPAYHFGMSAIQIPTDAGNDTWSLGTLPPNASGTLVVSGNIVGPANAQYQLVGTIGANFSGQNYPAASAPVNFTITPSPLSVTLTLNNSANYVVRPGDSLNYVLTYTNNSNVTFQTVNISAVLSGAMYDLSSLTTDGTFNSQTNTITWYTANTPALASLAPGQSGSVNFSVSAKQGFPIHLPSDKNYSVTVTAKATSPTVPANTQGANTTSVISLTNKVGGEISLTTGGYAKETTPGITNSGPYPPKVNQPTQYTVHWAIANYSTDASSVTVSAYLQSGTTFTGVATSTGVASASVPVYNAGTGLVKWTIPFIPATTGVISPPVQTVFQVVNTPAVNQLGQTITLIGPATITATDVYTNQAVQTTAAAVTTHLPNDPSTAGQLGVVTQ